MNKKILKFVIVLCLFSFLYSSCDFLYNSPNTLEYVHINPSKNEKKEDERLWTILIYMAADNDLEYSAIEDIYEMECSKLDTDKVSVFFLLDRSEVYDTSNDNWSGTRLYQLQTGRHSYEKEIISKELFCPVLGLKKGANIDLDMSSPYVLTNALSYINDFYPAPNLGLIMWGHGTGWRAERDKVDEAMGYKGFAHDNSSGCYMTLQQFCNGIKMGLNGKKLNLLGLDTCFGGEIEVMYELKDSTEYAVGTEGLLFMSGWNYKRIFDSFEIEEKKTPENFVKNVVHQFSEEYSQSLCSSIVGIKMSFLNDYFRAFDTVMKITAEKIETRKDRDEIANIIFSNGNSTTLAYSYGGKNSDVYLDINSIFNNLASLYSYDDEITKSIENFDSIKNKCIIADWASNNESGGLGVYYGTLTAGNLISSIHPDCYIKGKTSNQIQFVIDSLGYVPNINNKNSFLDKLFYTSFKQ